MERLEPLEKLDKDYYLGDQSGWYSDGDNRDSESSNDELSEQISKLAGVRRCKRRSDRGSRKESRSKDDFESDMDEELDERLVAHASEFMQANTSTSIADTATSPSNKSNLVGEDSDIPPLEKDSDEESAFKERGQCKPIVPSKDDAELLNLPQDGASKSSQNERNSRSTETGGSSKKSVSFKEEVEVSAMGETSAERSATSKGNGGKSAFDDMNNLLRKAADKARKEAEHEVEFYDANEDDDNERWVKEHRRRLGLFSDERKGQRANGASAAQNEKDDDTDAVLSCPACMTLLSRQCQRHDFYRDQYRAVFVENCKVVTEETVFMPESGRKKRKVAKKYGTGPKPNTVVSASEAMTLRREDLFHPVRCAICSTAVGVYDANEKGKSSNLNGRHMKRRK